MMRKRTMNQTRRLIKRYLKEYRRLTEKIRQLDEDINALRNEIGSQQMKGDPVTSSSLSDPTAKLAVRLADLKTRKENLRALAWQRREEIAELIDEVPDTLQSRLLYDRYILLYGWRQVADDIHVSEEYARGRLHDRALGSAEERLKERGII